MPLLGTAILAVWNEVDPANEPDFNDWYLREHVPERLSVPGMNRGRRYRAEAGTPRYMAFYEADIDGCPDPGPVSHAARQSDRLDAADHAALPLRAARLMRCRRVIGRRHWQRRRRAASDPDRTHHNFGHGSAKNCCPNYAPARRSSPRICGPWPWANPSAQPQRSASRPSPIARSPGLSSLKRLTT